MALPANGVLAETSSLSRLGPWGTPAVLGWQMLHPEPHLLGQQLSCCVCLGVFTHGLLRGAPVAGLGAQPCDLI